MTITTHTAVGAAIGYSVGNPLLGFTLGLASHFLLDMIPHGDSKFSTDPKAKNRKAAYTYSALDSLFAIFLLLLLMNDPTRPAAAIFTASIAGSILPDLLIGLHELTKSKYLAKFTKFHFFFHNYFLKKYGDVKLHYSLVVQAGFIAILLNLT